MSVSNEHIPEETCLSKEVILDSDGKHQDVFVNICVDQVGYAMEMSPLFTNRHSVDD